VGGCVPNTPDPEAGDSFIRRISTDRRGRDAGFYEATNLPFGNYVVTAKKGGEVRSQQVVINSSNPTAVVDFQFN
jgi:hypothetical protein